MTDTFVGGKVEAQDSYDTKVMCECLAGWRLRPDISDVR